jgi:site-specific DNA-methyltransferase (adenine-specific)
MAQPPGQVRDAILAYLGEHGNEANVAEIYEAVERRLGWVAASSVRSYLNLNTPSLFERTARGCYRLKSDRRSSAKPAMPPPTFIHGRCSFYQVDCFDWLEACEANSVHAVVTDPPYGLVEYSVEQQEKLINGHGGVWRIPPSFDGHKRAPLPRFTVLKSDDHEELRRFFTKLGKLLRRVVVPGANVLIATNPLLCHIVIAALAEADLEPRGVVIRLVMTMRGGDRPKNAHKEFPDVSVMPRSMWEPWVVCRRPLDGRVADNLRRWRTGGFRRPSPDRPFADVIRSGPTSKRERALAPHPSLKPQAFLRQIVRAVLPLGEGVVIDPFAGSGSTLAAAEALGLNSIGLESEHRFAEMARDAIPRLASLNLIDPTLPELPNAGLV